MPHHIFANGQQYMDWIAVNCDRCARSVYNREMSRFECEIEDAIEMALFDEGTVSDDIARRAGALDHPTRYCWPCPEKEATP